MRTTRTAPAIAVAAVFSLALAACGSDTSDTAAGGANQAQAAGEGAVEQAEGGPLPTIAVTTNVLGDVVESVVGSSAEVITIMPVGADPHDFQASAQEVVAINNAAALIANGASFEEGLLDVIDAAGDEGVPTFEAISAVDTIEFGEGGHDDHDDEHGDHADDDEHSDDEDHSDEGHDDEDHSDEGQDDEEHDDDHDDEKHSDDEEHDDDHDEEEHSDEEKHDDHDEDDDSHDHSGEDPHFFTDPMRMAAAVDAMVDFLQAEVEFADPSAVEASAAAYIADLTALDDEVTGLVESIPEERRVLVTNHDVFGYFANRYGFEVVGAVIPSGSTTDSASAGEIAELAEKIDAEGVPAIFADTSSSNDLVEALADEVGDVAVVELYSESLGEVGSEGATYIEMIRTNAERMSSALA